MRGEAIYVGIDVSKERLDVVVRPNGDGWGVGYNQSGVDVDASRFGQ